MANQSFGEAGYFFLQYNDIPLVFGIFIVHIFVNSTVLVLVLISSFIVMCVFFSIS